MTIATSEETRPTRKKIAVAVQRLLLVGYIPWKNIAKEDSTNANVPSRIAILKGTVGVPRISIMPNTVKFRAASMPGKQALTIGFIRRSSASEDIGSKWDERVYTVLDCEGGQCPSALWNEINGVMQDAWEKTIRVERR